MFSYSIVKTMGNFVSNNEANSLRESERERKYLINSRLFYVYIGQFFLPA